jgi:hypothetical protein
VKEKKILPVRMCHPAIEQGKRQAEQVLKEI